MIIYNKTVVVCFKTNCNTYQIYTNKNLQSINDDITLITSVMEMRVLQNDTKFCTWYFDVTFF